MTYKALSRAFFALFPLGAAYLCGFDAQTLWRRGGQFFFIVKKMLPPDWSFVPQALAPLLQTAEMALCGTAFGAVAALCVAPFCSAAVAGGRVLPAVLRTLVNVLRSVPALVLALAASFWLGTGTGTGAFALFLYSFGILARLGWEAMDLAPSEAFESLAASGCGRAKAFVSTTLIQIMPGFLTNALYILEANVRHAAILGYVGAGGLGLVLSEKLAWREYPRVGAILALLCGAVWLIEAVSARLRSHLSGTAPLSPAVCRVGAAAFAALLAASTLRLSTSGATQAGYNVLRGLLGGLLRPDAKMLLSLSREGVPYLLVETLCMACAGTAVGALLALPLALCSCRPLVPPLWALPVRAFSALLRTVPAVVYGLMFIRVAGPGPFAGLLTFAALSLGMCIKLFTGVFDECDTRPLDALRAFGCRHAALVPHALWPQARAALGAATLYRFDVNVREASVMGLVGAGGIGAPLLFSMNAYNWNAAGACLLGLTLTVLAVDAVSSHLRRRALRK